MIQALLIDAFFAALAGIGFGIVFNPPKKVLLMVGMFSAVGHSLRLWLTSGCDMNICAATIIGASFIGFLGLLAGKVMKAPAEIFSIPASLPMIPRVYAYKAILVVVKFLSEPQNTVASKSYMASFLSNGLIAVSVTFAIVLGVSASIFIDTLSSKKNG